MYGPGVSAATVLITVLRKLLTLVTCCASLRQYRLMPTEKPEYGAIAWLLQFRLATEASAALVWPGPSISGTTVMNRELAYATRSWYSAAV